MKKINIPQIPQTVNLTVNLGGDPKKTVLIGIGLYMAAKRGAQAGVKAAEPRVRSYGYGGYSRLGRYQHAGPIRTINSILGETTERALYRIVLGEKRYQEEFAPPRGFHGRRIVRDLEDDDVMEPSTDDETQDAKRGDDD